VAPKFRPRSGYTKVEGGHGRIGSFSAVGANVARDPKNPNTTVPNPARAGLRISQVEGNSGHHPCIDKKRFGRLADWPGSASLHAADNFLDPVGQAAAVLCRFSTRPFERRDAQRNAGLGLVRSAPAFPGFQGGLLGWQACWEMQTTGITSHQVWQVAVEK
jgi:hypothetical protein